MRIAYKLPLFAPVLLASSAAFAGFSECPQFFVKGVSPQVSRVPALQRELCFSGFAILHSGQSKTAVYVAEKLNRATLDDARGETRTDHFYEEARLPSAERSRLQDFKNSGLDRGHLFPAADAPNPDVMAQTFSLANMVPQAPQNNRGPWAKSIEKATRDYARRAKGDVYVVTGPVYSGEVRTIGTGKVWVPTYLFKLVYDATSGRAWAHWIENTNEARASRPISYVELVRRTGIDFFPGTQPTD